MDFELREAFDELVDERAFGEPFETLDLAVREHEVRCAAESSSFEDAARDVGGFDAHEFGPKIDRVV